MTTSSALLTLIAYVRMTSFALFRQIAVEKTRLSSSDCDSDQAVPEILIDTARTVCRGESMKRYGVRPSFDRGRSVWRVCCYG